MGFGSGSGTWIISGATGVTGAHGPTGLDGTNGTNGTNGTDGIHGVAGATGVTGLTGQDGGTNCVFNAQTGTTYTLAIEDVGKLVTLTNELPVTVTIPINDSVPFEIGSRIDLIQAGAGKVTFSGAGVTIKSKSNNKSISAVNVAASLIKESTDSWYLIGDLIL